LGRQVAQLKQTSNIFDEVGGALGGIAAPALALAGGEAGAPRPAVD
jgi:hypothetical protein